MFQTPFVHLRLHSEYSVTDSVVRLNDLVAATVGDQMPALALTDLGNVFGLVKFYQAARNSGIKPIIGCDVWIENAATHDKPYRLLLLCQTRAGYRNLCELVTRAYRENQRHGRAELKTEWFSSVSTEGLIVLSGAHLGDVGAMLLAGNHEHAEELARDWAKLFPQRYYLELQRLKQAPDGTLIETCVQHTLQLASDLKLPVVATHPVQFLQPGDFTAHETRVCIAEGYALADQRRPRRFSPDQYFKSQSEMRELFADIPQALANTVEIAKRCNVTLEIGKPQLPRFPVPEGMDRELYLRHCALEGLERRLGVLYPNRELSYEESQRYSQRLDYEIRIINQMGFAGYFLIVADFINWAKSNGVPVGPGRGSGAGSLVAYALGITELDPLRYGLLFERFLNPERISMPDFDIDFCQDGRDRVIDYVKHKYGADSVSQIATFGTMAAKGVVRDVGRALEWTYGEADELARLIPAQPGKTVVLKRRTDPKDDDHVYAREVEPLLNEREAADEETRELLVLAEQLEGMTRNVGMHAGGVLIAPGKLTDFCPLYAGEGSDAAVSQFDMKDVEAVGLVKFDFLGLTTLTILDLTIRFIHQLDAASTLKLEELPLDDGDTYKLFAKADTTAIFQFESRGMRDMLKRARPDRFEDLIALIALYRPGPMALIPDFVERKHGRQRVQYLDPRLEPILAQTYGVMVYQEQVMQIVQAIGGYTLGGADLLRRAMGKKDDALMAQQHDTFIVGAVKNGLTQRRASELFDLIQKFAGYGFNKSHAAAYALVAYQTAYFKAHHSAAFLAANMSAVMNDTDKVQQFAEDARAHGIEVLAPDINQSGYRFEPVDAKTIRYGLGAIKGTGEAAIASMVQARESGGTFRDLFDFCYRVDKRLVNRRVVEALVRAGAFDAFNVQRASLLASVGTAIESADQASRNAQQVSLFGNVIAGESLQLINAHPWSEAERLQNEKLALGFYLSGHPFKSFEREIREFAPTRLDQITPGTQPVILAGLIHSFRTQMTRRGKMAVITLDDGTARVELTVFNELFEQHRHWLKEDVLLIVEGKVALDEFTGGLRVTSDKLCDFAAARSRFAKRMRLEMNGQANAAKLKELLAPYCNGSCPVSVVYYNQNARCEVELGEGWRVNLKDDLLQSLVAWLSVDNVRIIYRESASGN
jgi:DNA polymerase-3 subunit alpha